jgi:transcriptional regulator with XRE-family HTH domain
LQLGLTQEGVAERAGLSVHAIQKLERGTTHPYRPHARADPRATGNYPAEGRRWLAEVLAPPDPDRTPALARALMGAGDMSGTLYDFGAAEPLLREALAVSRALQDEKTLTFALFHLSQTLFWRGVFGEAQTLAQEGASRGHAAGLRTQEAQCEQVLSAIAYRQEDFVTSRDHAERELALATADGYARGIATGRMYLGRVYHRLGDLGAARAQLEAGLLKFHESDYPVGTVHCLIELGWIATASADFRRARECFREALRTSLELNADKPNTETLEGFAQLAEAQHRPRSALRLAAAATAQRDANHGMLSPADRSRLEPPE